MIQYLKSKSPLLALILAAIFILPATNTTITQPELEKIIGEILGVKIEDGYFRVVNVVDGDTIKVSINDEVKTVRLLAIDTPETKDPRKPVQCFGQQAANHLQSLLLDQPVHLEPDTIQGDKDRYGRLLRYIYLPDGTFVNAKMVRDGYAFAYTKLESDQLEHIKTQEAYAKDNGLGLWSECDYD